MTNKDLIKSYLNSDKLIGYGGNIFYESDLIYSYGRHYLLGKKVGGVLYVNATRYSVTTSKHAALLRYQASVNYGLHVLGIENLTRLVLIIDDNGIKELFIKDLVREWLCGVVDNIARNGKELKKQGVLELAKLIRNIKNTMSYMCDNMYFDEAMQCIVDSLDEYIREKNISDSISNMIWGDLLSSIEQLNNYKRLNESLTSACISHFDHKKWGKLAINISSDGENVFNVYDKYMTSLQDESYELHFNSALSINQNLFACVDEKKKVQIFSSVGIGELVAVDGLQKVAPVLKDYYKHYNTENLNV